MELNELPEKYRKQAEEKLEKQKNCRFNTNTNDVNKTQPQAKTGGSTGKYHNTKVVVDGYMFDSKKEAKYYLYLKEREKAGEITDLTLHPSFELQPRYSKNGKKIREIDYEADFSYRDENDDLHIIDVKGMKTDVYRLKKKIFEYLYPDLTITEV